MREYLLTLLVAAAMTYVLTPLVRRLAIAVRALPEVRDRDVHAVPTPRLGGLAMYGGLAAALLVASHLTHMKAVFASNLNVPGSLGAPGSLLLAGGLIVATGFVDDRWGMSATSKLAAQVAASGILVWGGVELDWVPLPRGSVLALSPGQGVVLTILVVVVTINAVNFIDGLDGLAAGVVGIAAFAFFIYSYELTRVVGLPHQSLPALVSAVLTGMCLGFLPHNFYPARIFMGDTGAMLIGLVLAYATISSTANLDPATLQQINRFPLVLPLMIPVAILVIPYVDLLLAVIRRARAGMSVFTADRGHVHHRLLNIGHSHRLSVLILYLWASLFAFTVVMLSIAGSALAVISVATVGGMVALLLVSMPWLRAHRPPEGRHQADTRRAGVRSRRRPAQPPGSSEAGVTGTGTGAAVAGGPVGATAGNGACASVGEDAGPGPVSAHGVGGFPPRADFFPPSQACWSRMGEPGQQSPRPIHAPSAVGAPLPRANGFPQQDDTIAAPDDASSHAHVNGRARPAPLPRQVPRAGQPGSSPPSADGASAAGTSGKGLTKSL